MRGSLLAVLPALFVIFAPCAQAAEPAADVKGVYLLTDYPALTVRPGSTSTISLRLQNYSSPPERFALSVEGAPAGWTATLIGGGQPVAAAMAGTNSSVSLQLRVDVPSNAAMGTHTLTVHADSDANKVSLPVAVTLAKELPAKLSLEPKLPSLRGSAKSSFEYQISIKNDSGKPLLVSLAAQAPQNFDTSFTEAYGSQELSSIPVEAGTPKDVKLRVRPPATVKAGQYPVTVRVTAEDASAETKVTLDITGQPQLGISGRDGRVSDQAYAGTERAIPIEITNSGTAPADDVELSGSGPS
ncbi:NEW3 domain-containing protein, partial [Sphingomonas sp.]|uniref:COG1470 family protein n=1 Tax=Sphingomonas sp. TaxID=28214 RepID=UPI0025EAFEBD